MLPLSLSRLPALSTRLLHRGYTSTTPRHSENRIQPNDPTVPKNPPNVSETNALPVDAVGARDAPLQEMPEEGEKQRQMQAPNRAKIWSRSQQPRDKAMTGPRFEQTIMEYQVCLPSRSGLVIGEWIGNGRHRVLTLQSA